MVEISISPDGELKVAQHDDLRLFVRRLLPEGFVRHHAVERPNVSEREEKFLRGLAVFFVVTLALTLFNLMIAEAFLTQPTDYGRVDTRWLFLMEALAVFAAVLAGAVFVVMTTNDGPTTPPPPPPPPPPGKQATEKVPAVVQQV